MRVFCGSIFSFLLRVSGLFPRPPVDLFRSRESAALIFVFVCAQNMRFSALLVFVAVTCALGHNWLESPKTRNNNNQGGTISSNTNSPCDIELAGGYAPGTSQFNKFVGDSIALDFSQNHSGNDQYVTIATYTAGDTNLAANYVVQQSWTRQGADGTGTNTATITTPNNPGKNTLQWSWSGYYNCVDFTILVRPPTDAELTDDDNNGEWAANAGYIYETADGHGLFNSYTGEMVCDDGWVEYYEEGSSNLAGCTKAGNGVIYVTITLNFGNDNLVEGTDAGWSEENWIAAVADALNCDPSQIEITNVEMDSETTSLTMAFYDGDDKTAVDLYNDFSAQYRDDQSALNTDELTSWIDTTQSLEVDDSDPNSDSAASVGFGVAAGAVVVGSLLL